MLGIDPTLFESSLVESIFLDFDLLPKVVHDLVETEVEDVAVLVSLYSLCLVSLENEYR